MNPLHGAQMLWKNNNIIYNICREINEKIE